MRFLLGNRWVLGAAFTALVTVCSITVHPFGASKQFQAQVGSIDDLKLPAEITTIFKRSCMDCHSSQTTWPWYSYVAPASWLVERDVRRGRDHMNFSEWQQYTFQQRDKLLADVASAVKNGEMPLRQYTFIHREAKLTDAERDLVYQWARRARRRLRAESQSTASQNIGTHGPTQAAGVSEAAH